jgi:hypothetical protein
MDQFDRTMTGTLSSIDNNPYLSSALSLFLVLYAGLAAPQLPEYVARLFDNPLFKLLMFFLVAYSARKNPTVAIIASVGLMVSLHTLTKFKVNRQLTSMIFAQEAEAEATQAQAEADADADAEDSGEEVVYDNNLGLDIDSNVLQEEGVPEGALAELQAEEGATLEESMEPPAGAIPQEVNGGCAKRANFRNSFYPQYVNMKPDAYDARYTGSDVNGFDASSAYASI